MKHHLVAFIALSAMLGIADGKAMHGEVKIENDVWIRGRRGDVVCRQGGGSAMIDEGAGWQRRTDKLTATNSQCEITFDRTVPCRIDDVTLTRDSDSGHSVAPAGGGCAKSCLYGSFRNPPPEVKPPEPKPKPTPKPDVPKVDESKMDAVIKEQEKPKKPEFKKAELKKPEEKKPPEKKKPEFKPGDFKKNAKLIKNIPKNIPRTGKGTAKE